MVGRSLQCRLQQFRDPFLSYYMVCIWKNILEWYIHCFYFFIFFCYFERIKIMDVKQMSFIKNEKWSMSFGLNEN